MLEKQQSRSLFEEAKKHMPGGVNSPVRAFGAVGGEPLFIEKAKGAYIWDADGNKYIDYVCSWGPAILGHAHPEVVAAVQAAAENGLSFGAPTRAEITLAKLVKTAVPSIEKLRFVSSGTEACMSAIRMARGFTGRDKILKFDGNYHGHADSLLVKAGSGVATFGLPDSPGVPKKVAEDTVSVPYNDPTAVHRAFEQHGSQIAAIIVEPIVGNSGFIKPVDGFLEMLREITEANKSLLIFDEVMTGFRVAFGGVQTLLGIKPDLSTFGKVIGGGLPLAAFGGREDIMNMVAPVGPIYQAGTLSGNPLATACGAKTLELLGESGVYEHLTSLSKQLCVGLEEIAAAHGFALTSNYEGGMFGFFFAEQKVLNFSDAKHSDLTVFTKFFNEMQKEGIYIAPSAYEAGFLSIAHTSKDIEATLAAAERVFERLKNSK